jgi:hypothetical protein
VLGISPPLPWVRRDRGRGERRDDDGATEP